MMVRVIVSHGKQFLGWLLLLVATWLIASSAREYIVSYLSDNSTTTLFLIGIVILIFAVVVFGKKAPWQEG